MVTIPAAAANVTDSCWKRGSGMLWKSRDPASHPIASAGAKAIALRAVPAGNRVDVSKRNSVTVESGHTAAADIARASSFAV